MKFVHGIILTWLFVAQAACGDSLSRSKALQHIQERYALTGKMNQYDEFGIPQAYRQNGVFSTGNTLPFNTTLRDLQYLVPTLKGKRDQMVTEGGLKGYRPLNDTYWTRFNQEKFLADGHIVKNVKKVKNWKFKAYKGKDRGWNNFNTKAKIFSVKAKVSHTKPVEVTLIEELGADEAGFAALFGVRCARMARYNVEITWTRFGQASHQKPEKTTDEREACFVKTDAGWQLAK